MKKTCKFKDRRKTTRGQTAEFLIQERFSTYITRGKYETARYAENCSGKVHSAVRTRNRIDRARLIIRIRRRYCRRRAIVTLRRNDALRRDAPNGTTCDYEGVRKAVLVVITAEETLTIAPAE